MKAFIFAAGKGTRLKPFTNHHPKALAQVNNIPLLERNIKYLQSFGINDFILDFLAKNKNFGANIQISNEHQELLETGGALVFAKKFLKQDENILIMNADILTQLNISDFINFHLKSKNIVTLAVSNRESSRKLLFNKKDMSLNGWRNEKTNEEILRNDSKDVRILSFSGIHCINTSLLNLITKEGKFSIMEIYLELMRDYQIIGYEHNDLLIDVGKPESIVEAEKYFN